MKLESDVQTDDVRLPALFTVRALAELANVTEEPIGAVLREGGVRRVRAGRRMLVPLAEIQKKLPVIFDSLQLLVSRRRARERGNRR